MSSLVIPLPVERVNVVEQFVYEDDRGGPDGAGD